ncbi:phosphatidylinositol N-acetylglucosaminyltransferase subunit P [Diorhabda sublineata]|uniref:phosphatidylinositol N-acetylglucosaminyltransferase subunit P n=1 Tax=Diorhabda sublineata TaxID=1163346 RepID=UPI0024E168EF|nr:phosphatidylinositol N-acetylglucosaminyltransferase subunit P [Diorhabda sublineata]
MPEHTPTPTPSRAVYGFVMYLSFRIFFIIYLIWAVVPESYFRLMGITFLPQRHWAITVPIYLLTVLTIVAFVIYPSLGLCMTPAIDDIRTIRDEIGCKRRKNGISLRDTKKDSSCICKDKGNCCKELYESIQHTFANNAIPVLRDLDISDVSELLYLDNKMNC